MSRAVRNRFWPELVLVIISLAVMLTLVWHDWIELVFGVEPDGGDGSLEWAMVAVMFIAALMASLIARNEWQCKNAIALE